MFALHELRCALPDHHTGRHRIPGRYARQDGSVCDTEAFHTVDLQSAIDDRHPVPPHFRRPGLMPKGRKSIPKEALQVLYRLREQADGQTGK